MSTVIVELYEALKSAGVPDEQAKDAAKAVEDVREAEPLQRIELDVSDLKGDMKLLSWMLGFLLALGIANLVLLIRLGMG